MKRIRKLSASLVQPIFGGAGPATDDHQHHALTHTTSHPWPLNPARPSPARPMQRRGITTADIRRIDDQNLSSPPALAIRMRPRTPTEIEEAAQADYRRHLKTLEHQDQLWKKEREEQERAIRHARIGSDPFHRSHVQQARPIRIDVRESKALPSIPGPRVGDGISRGQHEKPYPVGQGAQTSDYKSQEHRPRRTEGRLNRSASDTRLPDLAHKPSAVISSRPKERAEGAERDQTRGPKELWAKVRPRRSGSVQEQPTIYQSTPDMRARTRQQTTLEMRAKLFPMGDTQYPPPKGPVYSPFARMDGSSEAKPTVPTKQAPASGVKHSAPSNNFEEPWHHVSGRQEMRKQHQQPSHLMTMHSSPNILAAATSVKQGTPAKQTAQVKQVTPAKQVAPVKQAAPLKQTAPAKQATPVKQAATPFVKRTISSNNLKELQQNVHSTERGRTAHRQSNMATTRGTSDVRAAVAPVNKPSTPWVKRSLSAANVLSLQQDGTRGDTERGNHHRQPSNTAAMADIRPLKIVKRSSNGNIALAGEPTITAGHNREVSKPASSGLKQREEESRKAAGINPHHREHRADDSRSNTPSSQGRGKEPFRPFTGYDSDIDSIVLVPSDLSGDMEHWQSAATQAKPAKSGGTDLQGHGNNSSKQSKASGDRPAAVDTKKPQHLNTALGRMESNRDKILPVAPKVLPAAPKDLPAAPKDLPATPRIILDALRQDWPQDIPDSPSSCYSMESATPSVYQRFHGLVREVPPPMPPLNPMYKTVNPSITADGTDIKRMPSAHQVTVNPRTASVYSHRAEVFSEPRTQDVTSPPATRNTRPHGEEVRHKQPVPTKPKESGRHNEGNFNSVSAKGPARGQYEAGRR